MFTFASLKVKCPLCDSSLIDHENLVDNEPSILLNIVSGEKNGFVRLSSLYGSYNFFCNLKIPLNAIIEFYCPSCNAKISSDMKCEQCSAPMIPLKLSESGTVSFCSRRGCKKHFIEFDEMDTALRMLEEEYSYASSGYKMEERHEEVVVKTKTGEEVAKGLIKSKAYLMSYCPLCKKTLIENKAWKFEIESGDGQKGFLWLNPHLNEFAHISSIYLAEFSVLKDIRCLSCHSSLLQNEKKCPQCSSLLARTLVATPFKIIDFYICTKKGCRWHGINEEDMRSVVLEEKSPDNTSE